MAVSMQDVIFALGSDEPDYARAASLGQEALPYLEQLINSGSRLAPKATYLAGHIQDRASVDVLANAARRGEPEIWAAAAMAVRHLQLPGAVTVLQLLERDEDEGVKLQARRSLQKRTR